MGKTKAGPIAADRLKSFILRIEKLEEERKAIGGDIKDVYSEAKGVGYDVKTMRKVIALRGMDAADRAEQETLLDVYWHALTQIDRVENRVAAGESIRQAAKAEGMPKSTAIRQVTQNRAKAENGSVDLGGGPIAPGGPLAVAETATDAGVGEDDAEESSVPCPVSPADGAGKGNGLPSAKGNAEDSPAARRHTSDDALAPAIGISQCADDAAPGPLDTPPHGPTDELDRAAARLMDQSDGEITVKIEASPGSVFDRLGQALERVAPGRVERTVVAPDDDLTIPHFLRRAPA